jgi:hypothetical protein
MNLGDIRWALMDWIYPTLYWDIWRALVNVVKNLLVPQSTEILLSDYSTGWLLRRANLHEIIYICFPITCLVMTIHYIN